MMMRVRAFCTCCFLFSGAVGQDTAVSVDSSGGTWTEKIPNLGSFLKLGAEQNDGEAKQAGGTIIRSQPADGIGGDGDGNADDEDSTAATAPRREGTVSASVGADGKISIGSMKDREAALDAVLQREGYSVDKGNGNADADADSALEEKHETKALEDEAAMEAQSPPDALQDTTQALQPAKGKTETKDLLDKIVKAEEQVEEVQETLSEAIAEAKPAQDGQIVAKNLARGMKGVDNVFTDVIELMNERRDRWVREGKDWREVKITETGEQGRYPDPADATASTPAPSSVQLPAPVPAPAFESSGITVASEKAEVLNPTNPQESILTVF